jgi:putative peptidoglycan lipid II flippase
MREVARKSVIYTSIVVIPIAMGLVVFSEPLTYIIYGTQYSLAPAYLSLSALTGLTAVLGSYVIGSYLKSVGETVKAMKISLVNYAIYVPLALLLIPTYRVVGLIIASIVVGFSSTLYGLHIIRRDFRLEIVARRNVTVLGALSLPAVAAWLTSFLSRSSTVVEFLLGITVYLASLTLVLPAVIRRSEVLELIEITKNVKLLSFIAPKALSAILAISDLLNYARNRFSANKYS